MGLHHIGTKARLGAGAVAVALACGMGTAGVAFADEADETATDEAAVEQAAAEPRIELHEEWQPVMDASRYVFAGNSATDGDAQLAGTVSALLAFNQPMIDAIGKQCDAWSGACLGYAAAYSQTITTGEMHYWWEFDGNYGNYGESGFYGRNMTAEFDCYQTWDEQTTLRMLYDAINQGKPSILYVTTTSGNQHWVTVVGYENADENNLRPENFIMLDSNYAFNLEPVSLTAHRYTLRYGDTFGNVRVSKASTNLEDNRVPYEYFSDCYYGDWFVDSGVLDYAYMHGLVSGYSGTTWFGPWDSIKRQDVAVILWRLAGEPLPSASDSANDFDDVDYGMYYGNAIRWARETGVVNGYDDENAFKPGNYVTRQELACMIANYASKVAGVDTASDLSRVSELPDASSIASWAIASVGWCMDVGIMNGVDEDGTSWARPDATAWRASMASMAAVLHRDVLHLG